MQEGLRSVLAVAAGFLAIAVGASGLFAGLRAAAPRVFSDPAWASGPPSDAWLGGLVVAFVVILVAGGAGTAWLSPRTPTAHAAALGAALTAVAAVNLVNHPTDPLWYRAALLASALPASLAGGVLCPCRQRTPAEPSPAPDRRA